MGKEHQDVAENEFQPEQEPTATTDADTTTTAQGGDELALALKQVEEYKEALQRERADFQNYRKRTEREKEELKAKISGDTLNRILPVSDDFERALGTIPSEQLENDWMKGILLIHRKFQNLLEAEGIKIINPVNEVFDPNFHEAIGSDAATDTCPSGHVSAVLQKGYQKGDRVLRPAIVRVAE